MPGETEVYKRARLNANSGGCVLHNKESEWRIYYGDYTLKSNRAPVALSFAKPFYLSDRQSATPCFERVASASREP
jgi:predicted molibdopterin-dependent oxidoreductase YjgC